MFLLLLIITHISLFASKSAEPKPIIPIVPQEMRQTKELPKDTERIFPSFVSIDEDPPKGRWPKLQNETLCNQRREAVKEAFLWAWNAYKRDAWGSDEINPISRTRNNWLLGQGCTIIDSISTMMIMELYDEVKLAHDWVEKDFQLYTGRSVSLFETSIRILAGLISAYDLTGDELYLDKAEKLGDVIITNFESNKKYSIPSNSISLRKPTRSPSYEERKKKIYEDIEDKETYHKSSLPLLFTPKTPDDLGLNVTQLQQNDASIAEFGLWVEFVALSDRTGDPHYAFQALRALQSTLLARQSEKGIIPIYIEPSSGQFYQSCFSIGAAGDSFYEYLIKEHIYTEQHEIRLGRTIIKGQNNGDKYDHNLNSKKRNNKSNKIKNPKQNIEIESLGQHWVDVMMAFKKREIIRNKQSLDLKSSENVKVKKPLHWINGTECTDNKWSHLACYSAGNAALGAFYLNNYSIPKFPKQQQYQNSQKQINKGNINSINADEYEQVPTTTDQQILASLFQLGVDLGDTCYAMYAYSPSGLAGEFINMKAIGDNKEYERQDMNSNINKIDKVNKKQNENILRPEVVESLFYLYRTTGDTKYQEYAWNIFQSFQKQSRLPDSSKQSLNKQINKNMVSETDIRENPDQKDQELMGFTSLSNVNTNKPSRQDNMPSFFLAETLKYLYLTFCDANEVIPLDQWVFTTEAHPIALRKYLKKRNFS